MAEAMFNAATVFGGVEPNKPKTKSSEKYQVDDGDGPEAETNFRKRAR